MDRVHYNQKTEHLFKTLELTPQSRLLDYDFSLAIQNGDTDTTSKIIEIIEKLAT